MKSLLRHSLLAVAAASALAGSVNVFAKDTLETEKDKVSYMIGMDMGFNRYDLKRGPNDDWTARVTLPVCTASRADWIMELNLDGQFYSLPFTTR